MFPYLVFQFLCCISHVLEANPERFNSRFWNKMYYASVSHVHVMHTLPFHFSLRIVFFSVEFLSNCCTDLYLLFFVAGPAMWKQPQHYSKVSSWDCSC